MPMQISTFTHQHPHTYMVVYFYEPSSIGCENHQRTWLQDTALVFGLEDAKFTSDEVKEKVKIAQETEAKINTISQNYCILFACWLELGTFHCQKSVPIMLQSAFHIFPARVDSYQPKNDIEVFRELWACARFLSTSFANNLLYWFGSWTSHAKTLLRQFPMPLRSPAPFAQTSRSGCQSWLVALLSHDGAQQDAHFLQATWNVFYWSQLFFLQYACWPTIFSQYAWGMIVYDDYLCVCNISGFPAGKCTAPLVWALWIILLPVLIHMEWVAVDNRLEFWFKSVSRVHQGTIINCHSIAWRWLVLWFLRKVGSFALSAIQGHSDKCIFVYWVCFGPDSLRAVPSRPIILPVICQVLTGCLRASGHPRREQGHTSPGSDHGGKNAHTLGMGCTEASYSNPST